MFPAKFYYTASHLVNPTRKLPQKTTQEQIPLNSSVGSGEHVLKAVVF